MPTKFSIDLPDDLMARLEEYRRKREEATGLKVSRVVALREVLAMGLTVVQGAAVA